MDIIIILIISVCLTYIFIKTFLRPTSSKVKSENSEILKRLPGPFCLPIFGHLQLFFTKDPNIYLADLSVKYGDIFQLKIGLKTVVVLNSLDVIKEAFQEWEFAGRPHLITFDALTKASSGPRFAFTDYSNQWKFLRKNAIKALSLFGNSKSSRLQNVVDEAADSFANDIRHNLDRPFNPKIIVGECIAAITGSINFGGQFNRHDPLIRKLSEMTDVAARFIQLGSLMDYFPLSQWFMQWKINQFIESIRPMIMLTENHVRSYRCNEEITDIADALNAKCAELSKEELENANLIIENVQMISNDLFAAGFTTTSETFNWCLALLAKYPDIQKMVALELRQVITNNNCERLTLNDMKETPYTEAFLLEVFRFSSLLPLNLAHSTVIAKSFRGYYIPKDAIVISNLYSVHYNPKVFKEPKEFDPSRFLNPDGTLNQDMAQNIAPFGVGKRRCVGENLARQELYLLLASTICKFKISSVSGKNIEVHNADNGFSRRVYQHDFIFSLRQ